jgi:hypothetical protein
MTTLKKKTFRILLPLARLFQPSKEPTRDVFYQIALSLLDGGVIDTDEIAAVAGTWRHMNYDPEEARAEATHLCSLGRDAARRLLFS